MRDGHCRKFYGGSAAEAKRRAGRANTKRRYDARRNYASYYTSAVPIVARLGYRPSPREPLPRLFRRWRVGDFKQAVAGVAIDVSAQEPGLAPFLDRAARHPECAEDVARIRSTWTSASGSCAVRYRTRFRVAATLVESRRSHMTDPLGVPQYGSRTACFRDRYIIPVTFKVRFHSFLKGRSQLPIWVFSMVTK